MGLLPPLTRLPCPKSSPMITISRSKPLFNSSPDTLFGRAVRSCRQHSDTVIFQTQNARMSPLSKKTPQAGLSLPVLCIPLQLKHCSASSWRCRFLAVLTSSSHRQGLWGDIPSEFPWTSKCSTHHLERAIPLPSSFQINDRTNQFALGPDFVLHCFKACLIPYMVLFLRIFVSFQLHICKTVIKIPTCYFMPQLWVFISLKPFLWDRLEYIIILLYNDNFKVIWESEYLICSNLFFSLLCYFA